MSISYVFHQFKPLKDEPLRTQRTGGEFTKQTSSPPRHALAPAPPDLTPGLAAFQAALPGSRGAAYLRQRGIPLALAQQAGVGSAAPGTWPHSARDWRGGRVILPHTMPDGRLVNLSGRAVSPAAQVPKAKSSAWHGGTCGAQGVGGPAAAGRGGGLGAGRSPA